MSKINWPGAAISAPIPPALVVCGNMEKCNVLTVAWTGIINTKPPTTYISVRPERYSYEIIRSCGEFTINFPSSDMARIVDYCGTYSGKKVDKFERCRLSAQPSIHIETPIIEQCPLSLECKVVSETSFGTHTMFVAEIVGVDIDEALISADGSLHLEKAHLLAFAHGSYYDLGKRIGPKGYAVRKPKKQGISRATHKQGAN